MNNVQGGICGEKSGKAQIKVAMRPRFEGEARIRGRSPRKSEGGVCGEGSVSSSPEIFWNFEL